MENIIEKEIINIINDNEELMDLNSKFKRILINFVNSELIDKKNNNEDNFEDVIIKFMDKDEEFKEKIIDQAKYLSNKEGDCKCLIYKMFESNYINRNSLDIIACLLDYITEVFNKHLNYIFKVLEDNKVFTKLLEINKDKNNRLNENIIEQLKQKSLELIKQMNKMDDHQYSRREEEKSSSGKEEKSSSEEEEMEYSEREEEPLGQRSRKKS